MDVAITSPPYWGQRGDDGIGLESDPREYIANLVEIFKEVGRCLKDDGTLWVNIGDAYNSPINWTSKDWNYSTLGSDRQGFKADNAAYTKNRGRRRAFIDRTVPWAHYGNLLAIPYRLVIALCDAGFSFRGEIIWTKRKALPEGRCRRPHRKHESIYLFAKSPERHRFSVVPPVPSVWDLKLDINGTGHSSTFPLSLPMTCLQSTGLTTGLVLDPFMGAGTTAVAAATLGFDFIGFELSPTHHAMAMARLAALRPQQLMGSEAAITAETFSTPQAQLWGTGLPAA